MSRMVSARELLGRTIVAFDPGTSVEAGQYTDGSPTSERARMHTPRITLDDGSTLYFVTEEHPAGVFYGTFIGRTNRPRTSK